jgi:hypothetical protein
VPKPDSILAARLTAQLLAGPPARDPVAVAERVFAVQGQDPRGFRLAVRARTSGLTAVDVDRALTEDRSLVVTWVNRGTLHLVRSEDLPILHAVTTPPLRTSSDRRLGELGLPPDAARRGVEVIERALAAEGPLAADELRERLAKADVQSKGQALYHLLFKATLDGLVVRGPIVRGKHAYVLIRDWLGPQEPPDRDAVLGEFARRYLAGHGPAHERDLARWARIPLRDVRRGFEAIAKELDQLDDGLVDLKGRPRPAEPPAARLLGAFEPCLLGWVSREPIYGDDRSFMTDPKLLDPFALVRGKAVAHWKLADGEVELDAFRRLSREDREALRKDAEDVKRFLG